MALSEDTRRRIPELSTGNQVPLHPALSDLPVASHSLAPVFDAIGLFTGSPTAGAAGLWTGAAAVLTSLPTAATGVADYLRAPADSPVKRIGIRHAALNTFALSMMIGSLISRRFRSEPTPLSLVFSAAAGAAVTYSSHLGGVMVYREGMRVAAAESSSRDRQAGEPGSAVDEWPVGEVAPSPLGATEGQTATIGDEAQDSPDIAETGMAAGAAAAGVPGAETPGLGEEPGAEPLYPKGREAWEGVGGVNTSVEEATDNPDDATLETRPEEAEEERRSDADAA